MNNKQGIWDEKTKTWIKPSGTVKQGRRPMFRPFVEHDQKIKKGSLVRLVEGDQRLVSVAAVHPSGTAVVLEEARAGYYHWNIGDVIICKLNK